MRDGPAPRDGGFFVDVENARLWSIAFGPADAPAVVAVGGWIGSWELWAGPFGVLSARWRCVGFDHRGAGATICEPASISHETLVDDVFAVMDAFGLERAVLAGESAGAAVVLAAAARRPDRVRGLVIVDGYVPKRPPTEDDPFTRGLRTDFDATIAAFVDACIPDPEQGGLRAWGRQILGRTTSELAVALRLAGGHDPLADLDRIDAPALVIHCDEDGLAPVAGGRAIAAGIRGSTLHVLPGSEHVPTMTRPAEIARLVDGWLAKLP